MLTAPSILFQIGTVRTSRNARAFPHIAAHLFIGLHVALSGDCRKIALLQNLQQSKVLTMQCIRESQALVVLKPLRQHWDKRTL